MLLDEFEKAHPKAIPDVFLGAFDSRATLVIYEQLIQERQVAEMLELGRDEIEDHFAGNAKRFLARMREAQSS